MACSDSPPATREADPARREGVRTREDAGGTSPGLFRWSGFARPFDEAVAAHSGKTRPRATACSSREPVLRPHELHIEPVMEDDSHAYALGSCAPRCSRQSMCELKAR